MTMREYVSGKKGMSRRSLLRGIALGTIGLAGAAAFGCGAQDNNESSGKLYNLDGEEVRFSYRETSDGVVLTIYSANSASVNGGPDVQERFTDRKNEEKLGIIGDNPSDKYFARGGSLTEWMEVSPDKIVIKNKDGTTVYTRAPNMTPLAMHAFGENDRFLKETVTLDTSTI